MSFSKLFLIVGIVIVFFESALFSIGFSALNRSSKARILEVKSEELDYIFQVEQPRLIGNLLLKDQAQLSQQIQRIYKQKNVQISLAPTPPPPTSDSEQAIRSFPVEYGGELLSYVTLSAPLNAGHSNWIRFGVIAGAQILIILLGFLFTQAIVRKLIIRPMSTLVKLIDSDSDIQVTFPKYTPEEIRKVSRHYSTVRSVLRSEHQLRLKGERDAALAEVAAQVSHDIRSPLVALSYIANHVEISDNESKLLSMAIQRIRELAEKILNLRKEQKQSLPVQPSHTVLEELVQEIVSEKRHEYSERPGLTIQFKRENPTLKSLVPGSDIELKSVFSNLINNSVEAISESGSVDIQLQLQSNQALIKIRDNGVGIPSSILNKLTNEEITHGKKDGSGIGVYSAANTIRRLGGTLKFKSEEQVGTTVFITLPLVEELDVSTSHV